MSDDVHPGFVLRGEPAAEHMRVTRSLERDRRIMRLMIMAAPWTVAVMMTALVVSDRYERAHHPLPIPEIRVAMVRANGISPPVRTADLTESDEAATLRSTVTNYIVARESYCFTCSAKYYKHVIAISAPDERTRYDAIMLDDKNPANPKVLYGTGLRAGTAEVDPTSVEVTQDPVSPNVFTAVFRVAIMTPNGLPRTLTKFANMQWLPAKDRIELADQQAYSPLGVGCWSYTSYIMETPR